MNRLTFMDGVVWTVFLVAFYDHVTRNQWIVAAFGIATLPVFWAIERWAAAPIERAGDKAGRWTARKLMRR